MATYEETIVLKDEVTEPAKKAAAAVTKLGTALRKVQDGLVKVGGQPSPFEAAAASAQRFADAMEKALTTQKELASVKVPALKVATAGAAPAAATSRPVATPAAVPSVAPAAAPAASKPVANMPKPAPVVVPVKVDGVEAEKQFKTLSSSAKAAEAAMVRAGALGDKAGFDKAAAKAQLYRDALARLPEGANSAAGAGKSIEKTLWNARNAMDVGRQSIDAAIKGIKGAFASLAQGDVKGAIAGVTDAVAGMAKMLDMVVPGLGQVVSAVVSIAGGVAGALAAAAVGGAKFAISVNEAERSATAAFTALGQGVTTGEQVKDMLDGLSSEIGIADDTLEPLTRDFMKLGVTGVDALKKLTLAAISANAIVGSDEGARAFADLEKKVQLAADTGQRFKLGTEELLKLGQAGTSVSEVAAKMGLTTKDLSNQLAAGSVDAKKFGDAMTDAIIEKGAGPLKAMSLEWANVKKMLDKGIADLFKGIDVGPFMAAVQSLFSVFDSGNASGKVMHDVIGGVFGELFSLATRAIPVVRRTFLQMMIWGLEAYIAVKPLIKKVREFFESAAGSSVLRMALDGIGIVLKGVGIAIGIVVGLFALMAAMTFLVGAAIWGLIGKVIEFAAALPEKIKGAVTSAMEALSKWAEDAKKIAGDFVNGLILGITGGVENVKKAVSDLASGAITAVRGIFDSHSPSRVMMGIGVDVGDGLVGGMEGSAPDVHGAASDMAAAAVSGVQSTAPSATAGLAMSAGASGGAGSSAPSTSSKSITIEKIEINGVKDAEDVLEPHRLALAIGQAFDVLGFGGT